MRITYAAVIALLLTCIVSTTAHAQDEWKPSRDVDIVVASAAAGSSDRTALILQKLLQSNASFPSVTVTNRPGREARRGILQLAQVHRRTALHIGPNGVLGPGICESDTGRGLEEGPGGERLG
jgi:tripartite-type tricarboxylate transporter receptor subunit TctC